MPFEQAVKSDLVERFDFREHYVADLENVANVEKMMPMSFIRDDGYGITEECRKYLQPLIQGENYPPYKMGLPEYVTLKNTLVSKKLPLFDKKI